MRAGFPLALVFYLKNNGNLQHLRETAFFTFKIFNMKKMKLLAFPIAILLLALASCDDDEGQQVDLPVSIKNYLSANHPNAEIEESEQGTLCTGVSVYEVELEVADDEEIDLTFDVDGNLLFTESEISVSEIPAAVSTSIANNYAGYSVKEAERLDLANDTAQYEIELKNGSTTLEVLFDASGEVICEEQDNDE